MQSRRNAIAAILAGAAAFAAESKPNFSGRWRLDAIHSSKNSPADLMENVDQREAAIRIDSEWNRNVATGVTNAAILAPAVELKTDGTETSNDMPLGLSLTTRSRWDGNKLVTEWRLNGLNAPMSGTWTRYLIGANTMVVDSVAEAGGHRVVSRFMFVK